MKLTEKELAALFQNSTKNKTAETTVGDTLSQGPATANRIQQAEQLMHDHSSAQGARMAMGLQGWSHQLASAIEQAQRPWFNFFTSHSPLKATLATGALAVTLMYAWPNQNSPVETFHAPIINQQVASDVIHTVPFEGQPSDQLFNSNMGETQTDSLFGGSFG